MDQRLRSVIDELEKTRWAATLLDPGYKLLWISREMKVLVGEDDEEKLGYGKHIVSAWLSETWLPMITAESQLQLFKEHLPYILYTTPKDELKGYLGELGPVLDEMEPVEPLPVHVGIFEYISDGFQPTQVRSMVMRLHDHSGEPLGILMIYGSALPARILALVARGDERMFTRMADLVKPGRRQAAVLFADLQESGVLSKRLPSAAYFQLIARLTDAIDRVVIDHLGIVGKHAGDGVTAYFLADHIGSSSGAAAAAIKAARGIEAVAGAVVKEVIEETGISELAALCVNVGVHWGGTLYMGQLVTGGRLEISALGDAVNECARIQESARDGQALVSKNLIEHLSDNDAESLGLDPDTLVYRTVGELETASDKARRDAGTIPVTPLSVGE
ncbi:MAG: adenylate/guanylate cyclase domain-containing protein [Actinomycetota bacterium]